MTPILRYLVLSLALLILPRSAHADAVADARKFMSAQVDAIKSGDVAAVKAGLSKRQRDKVTQAIVDKAKTQAAKITVEELVDKVEPGKDTLKIKMKNGRTLTTLVQEDGGWKADTLWFK